MERLKTIGLWLGAVVLMVLFFGGIFVYAWVKGSFLGAIFLFVISGVLFGCTWVSVECWYKLKDRREIKAGSTDGWKTMHRG